MWLQSDSQHSETALVPCIGRGLAVCPWITMRCKHLWQAPPHTSAQPVCNLLSEQLTIHHTNMQLCRRHGSRLPHVQLGPGPAEHRAEPAPCGASREAPKDYTAGAQAAGSHRAACLPSAFCMSTRGNGSCTPARSAGSDCCKSCCVAAPSELVVADAAGCMPARGQGAAHLPGMQKN